MPARRAKSQSISSDAPGAKGSTSPPASPKPASKTPKASHSRTSSLTTRTMPLVTRVVTPKPGKSTMSSLLRYLSAVVLSLSSSALLFSLSSEYTAGDLAAVSKHLESWSEIAGVMLWQVFKLGTIWYSSLDAADTIALSLALNYPSQVLLLYFYNIRPTTALLSTVISVTSTSFPIYLLRPTAPIHSFESNKQRLIPRLTRSIVSDPATTLSTAVLSATIVAVILEISFVTVLPSFLITHFDGLRTMEPAYRGAAGLPGLLTLLLPFGFAMREFLFVSSAASSTTAGEKAYKFDPARASFNQTLWHNVWGWYTAKEKTLIRRTALAITLVGAETAMQAWGTIKGTEIRGAVGWAGLWTTAIAIVGLAFGWVEGPAN